MINEVRVVLVVTGFGVCGGEAVDHDVRRALETKLLKRREMSICKTTSLKDEVVEVS